MRKYVFSNVYINIEITKLHRIFSKSHTMIPKKINSNQNPISINLKSISTKSIKYFSSSDTISKKEISKIDEIKEEKRRDITAVSIEDKKKFTNYFSNEYDTFSTQHKNENEILQNQINEKLFSKIFELKGETNSEMNSDSIIDSEHSLIKFNKSKDLLDSSKSFISTIDRTIDVKLNQEFSQLIMDNKLDFSNEKIIIKSMNLKDLESTGLTDNNKNDLYEIDFGKIKSFPNFKSDFLKLDKENLKILEKESEYDYEVSVLGNRIKDEDKINLNSYLALNEDERHYISPVIFHEDPDAKKDSAAEKETIFSYMLKNPFILFIFIIFCYYIYPNLWKKDYFMALSEDFNHFQHIKDKGSHKTYDYINYRRGLYASVRSNFS